ncbi:MAG: hypothetical protein U0U67_12780 [Chitinophagales bacterium]
METILSILAILTILAIALFLVYYIGSLLMLVTVYPLAYYVKMKLGIIKEEENFNSNLDKKFDNLTTGKTTNRFLELISSLFKAIS